MLDINIWCHIAQFLIFMSMCIFFIYRVFESKLRFTKSRFCVAIVVYVTVVSAIIALTITEISPFPNLSYLGMIAIILFSMFTLKALIRKNTFSVLFVFFIFLNVQYNTILLASATASLGFIPFSFRYENANILLLSTLYGMLFFPVVYYLLVKLYKRIVDSSINSTRMNFFFCLPAGFYFTLHMLMRINFSSPVAVNGDVFLPLILVNICSFCSYYAALISVLDSHDAAMERVKACAMETQLTLWQEQYGHLQAKIDADGRIRHDWRHHIIAVLGYVDSNDLDGLREYLSGYRERYLQPDEIPVCDVVSLNLLFGYYKRKAADLGIDFKLTPVLMSDCRIPVSELTVVFGNMLENAVEACQRIKADTPKRISLNIRHDSSNLIAIICENTFDGVVNRDSQRILSRKENGGLGLSSIENIANKYDGAMQVKVEGNTFKLYVSLQ